jgi:hypothetical protein
VSRRIKVALLYALFSGAIVMVEQLIPGAESAICRPASRYPIEN